MSLCGGCDVESKKTFFVCGSHRNVGFIPHADHILWIFQKNVEIFMLNREIFTLNFRY